MSVIFTVHEYATVCNISINVRKYVTCIQGIDTRVWACVGGQVMEYPQNCTADTMDLAR